MRIVGADLQLQGCVDERGMSGLSVPTSGYKDVLVSGVSGLLVQTSWCRDLLISGEYQGC